MSVQIQFLGASGTVTGSKYLVSYKRHRILVDAGMFQGSRAWREKNWLSPPFATDQVDAVCLTHAHIDHTGILPRYCDLGLRCPVYSTPATAELTKLLLFDSAHLQEQEAEYRVKRGKSRHSPALPLYTKQSAIMACDLLHALPFYKRYEILPDIFATWIPSGHILGAAAIQLEIGGRLITFSGDVGRYSVPIMVDPQPVDFGDLLLIESTYGNRLHASENPADQLMSVINRTYQRGGVIVIPSFAVGRVQLLLYYLRTLKANKLIPDLPVIIDSPMAADATEIYESHSSDYDNTTLDLLKSGQKPFSFSNLAFVQDVSESKKLNLYDQPMIIISASGMLTGGRILHHLKHRITNKRNTILFVGYQPQGGRGAWIKSGAASLRLFGDEYEIKAEIAEISGLSAHADQGELINWCRSCKGTPQKVAIVHGEPEAATALSAILTKNFNWSCYLPKYQEKLTI